MPVANFVESVVVYDDVENASNPQRKHVDWKRSATGLVFEQAYSERFSLAPGESRALFTTSVSFDLLNGEGPAAVDLTPVTAQSSWYQMRGIAVSPGATDFAVAAETVTFAAQSDGTLKVTGAGVDFTTTPLTNDWVYVAGSTYGDTGPASAANQGFWVITAVTTDTLYLRRVYETDPTPTTETVTIDSTLDLQLVRDAQRPRWVYIEGSSIFAGLKQVLGAASGWIAFASETQFVPVTAFTFTKIFAVRDYAPYLRVEASGPVTVRTLDASLAAYADTSMLLVSENAPGWVESFSFTTFATVINNGTAAVTVNSIFAVSAVES
jgi:hypothetical protein